MDRVWQGAALRRARMLARKSIKDVATRLGVTEGAISQQELGLTSPDRDQLRALAAFYGMPLETLLYELGEPVEPPRLTLREWFDQTRQKDAQGQGEAPASVDVQPGESARGRKLKPSSAGAQLAALSGRA